MHHLLGGLGQFVPHAPVIRHEVRRESRPRVDVPAAAVQDERNTLLSVPALHSLCPHAGPVRRDHVLVKREHVHGMARVMEQHGNHLQVVVPRAEDPDLGVDGAFQVSDVRRAEWLLPARKEPGHAGFPFTRNPAAIEGQIGPHRTARGNLDRAQCAVGLDDRVHDLLDRERTVFGLRAPQVLELRWNPLEFVIDDEVAERRRRMRLWQVHHHRVRLKAALLPRGLSDPLSVVPGNDLEVRGHDAELPSVELEDDRPGEQRLCDDFRASQRAPGPPEMGPGLWSDVDQCSARAELCGWLHPTSPSV